MPFAARKIDPLNDFREGVVRTDDRAKNPIPLKSTKIDAAIQSGFATVSTTRVFRNDEKDTIEATMTFPVPVDSVVHGVRVDIDGRRLVAVAQATTKARQTYETAIDSGKTAVLHEEKLKGVHMLSIAHIPPGKEVAVEIVWSKSVSFIGDVQTLRIPSTVAEIYGRSPLIAADDLIVHDSIVFDATLSVTTDSGTVRLDGGVLLDGSAKVSLDRPVILTVTDAKIAPLAGRIADGRSVELTVTKGPSGDAPLRAEILFDNSGSTNDRFHGDLAGRSIWELSSAALQHALAEIVTPNDKIALSEFNNSPKRLGIATGADIIALTHLLRPSQQGTEIGAAIASANSTWATDIVLITDGRSHALDVHKLATAGKRVSVVLCGANSLDAHVGHLAALTGGIIVVASSDNIADAIKTVISSLRTPATSQEKTGLSQIPASLTALRGGAEINISISGDVIEGKTADAIGAYAAFLALPLLCEQAAGQIAADNGLCTHLTSLVVVDEAAEAQQGLPNQRKVPLSAPVEASGFVTFSAAGGPIMASASNAPLRKGLAGFGEHGYRSSMLRGSGHSFDTSTCDSLVGSATQSFAPQPDEITTFDGFAGTIDWGANASTLAQGEISALDGATRRAITAATANRHVVALATALGVSKRLVVIALLAKSISGSDRNAARIARLVLDKADQALVDAAIASLGL